MSTCALHICRFWGTSKCGLATPFCRKLGRVATSNFGVQPTRIKPSVVSEEIAALGRHGNGMIHDRLRTHFAEQQHPKGHRSTADLQLMQRHLGSRETSVHTTSVHCYMRSLKLDRTFIFGRTAALIGCASEPSGTKYYSQEGGHRSSADQNYFCVQDLT
jgi:hypothetical protein